MGRPLRPVADGLVYHALIRGNNRGPVGGDDPRTLYVTAGGTLYSIRTTTPGRVAWPVTKALKE